MTKQEKVVYGAMAVIAVGILAGIVAVGSMTVISGFTMSLWMLMIPILPISVGGIYLLISEK